MMYRADLVSLINQTQSPPMSQDPFRPPSKSEYSHPNFPPQQHQLKHSLLGIFSFVLALLSGMGMFLVVGIAGYFEATTQGGMNEKSLPAIFVGLAMFFFMFLVLVSFALGLGALFQNSKKVFAILGIVFSMMIGIGTIGLVVIGLSMAP